jgi:hypothetical protein
MSDDPFDKAIQAAHQRRQQQADGALAGAQAQEPLHADQAELLRVGATKAYEVLVGSGAERVALVQYPALTKKVFLNTGVVLHTWILSYEAGDKYALFVCKDGSAYVGKFEFLKKKKAFMGPHPGESGYKPLKHEGLRIYEVRPAVPQVVSPLNGPTEVHLAQVRFTDPLSDGSSSVYPVVEPSPGRSTFTQWIADCLVNQLNQLQR